MLPCVDRVHGHQSTSYEVAEMVVLGSCASCGSASWGPASSRLVSSRRDDGG
jgi:hypothetical protein